jgi:hypothetical protein
MDKTGRRTSHGQVGEDETMSRRREWYGPMGWAVKQQQLSCQGREEEDDRTGRVAAGVARWHGVRVALVVCWCVGCKGISSGPTYTVRV